MIPLAGDEVTEAIAKKYLTDFETAEYIKRACERKKSVSFKDIFGSKIQVTKEDIAQISEDAVKNITKNIADRILELNGGQCVSAVFVVGGGGKHEGFTEILAHYLGLPNERVAIRGAEVLSQVQFEQEGIRKDSTLVTPLGICMTYYEQKNNFIHVMVNEQRVKLYDNGKVSVLDACVSYGFSKDNLFPIRGDSIHYTVNGEVREKKGRVGEVAEIKKNGALVSLNDKVEENDTIQIRPSTKGSAGKLLIKEIPECNAEITVTLFGRKLLCPKLVEANGEMVSSFYEVKNGDEICTYDYYSVKGLLEFAGMDVDTLVLLNGREAGASAKIVDGDVITKRPVIKPEEPEKTKEETMQEQMDEDPLLAPLKPLPDWMSDVPFDTAKLGSDGEVIPGAKQLQQEKTISTPVEEVTGPVFVTINGDVVEMPHKKNPIFVDVFDVYPFDMTKAGGTRLVTRINGEDKDFTEPIHDGDRIELFWES